MSAQLVFNLALLVAVGGLLIWFPDRMALIPLLISKVQPAVPEPRPAEPPAAARRPGRRAAAARAKKKPQKKRSVTRR